MILHLGEEKHPVQVLLDTRCSVPLINQQTAALLQIPLKKHQQKRTMESYPGEAVKGAGEYYTLPMKLQHRRHFSKEAFVVTPMKKTVDIFLPFWWIAKHAPQEPRDTEEVRFDSPACLQNCTKLGMDDFSLMWDDSVCLDPKVSIIGYVAAVQTKDPLQAVPTEFRQYLDVMGSKLADALPEHRPYDCKIELKEGSTASWGPIYPLSETELQALREWLREMERTGKMQRSTSSAGSPILFVPKPNGGGLRLTGFKALNGSPKWTSRTGLT